MDSIYCRLPRTESSPALTIEKNVMPKFSVVIIACNIENYIGQCLDSLIHQTFQDFEAIVVDDCSIDGTGEIIGSRVGTDPRFVVLSRTARGGSHLARKMGVALAKGEWTLFLDGDDELVPQTLEQLNAIVSNSTWNDCPDIIRFTRTVIAEHSDSTEQAKAMESAFNVKIDETLKGPEILQSVFSDRLPRRSSWSIISMMTKTDVLRRAFERMTDECLGRLEDAYEFFVLADTARSYAYCSSEPLYLYHWGRGITGVGLISIREFHHNLVGIAETVRALDAYRMSHATPSVEQCCHWFCLDVPKHISTDMVLRLNVIDEHDAVMDFARMWGSQVVVGELDRLISDRALSVLNQGIEVPPLDELWRLSDFRQEIQIGRHWANINNAPYQSHYNKITRIAAERVQLVKNQKHPAKFIDTESAKRLAIFCFYDSNGHAAKYIRPFLTDLMNNVTDLVVVANGKVDDEARAMFSQFTDRIIVRDNVGLDAAAYRQVMLTLGWPTLLSYDEVICLNDTVLGPVYPFKEMFAEMDSRKVDFWGITAYHEETVNGQFIPTHLQAYWHAYRRSLVASRDFQEYWQNLPTWKSYADVTHKHEIPFTSYFAQRGYSWSAYIDQKQYADVSSYPLLYAPMQLIRDNRCPVFKRRSFFVDYSTYFDQTAGQPAIDLYEYLRDHTTYDTDLIWDAILPNYNIEDIRKAMHLTYVLPGETVNPVAEPLPRSAFIFHIYFMDLLGETIRYLANIPDSTDIYITTTEGKIEQIDQYLKSRGLTRAIHYLPVKNRGRDVSALLVGAAKVVLDGGYDVVGFAHDKKSSQNQQTGHHGSETQGFAYKLLENTLGSADYVRNILGLFAQNDRLGMVSPIPPYHALYFAHTLPTDWGPNFENTKALVQQQLGLHVPMDNRKATMSAIGSCYWFRVDALRPLFARGWHYEDFLPEGVMGADGSISHAIERANGYIAQSQGYYPAWVLNDRYARIELDSLLHSTNSLLTAMGNMRQGETLLANCASLSLGSSSVGGFHAKIRNKVHTILRGAAKRYVQPLPEPMKSLIYRCGWFPINLYRHTRDRCMRSNKHA